MSARPGAQLDVVAGTLLGLAAVVMLLGAPVGVLLGQNAVEMAVVAIAGVGLTVVHLSIVVAVHGRAIARAAGGPRAVPITVGVTAYGGGGGGGGPRSSSHGGSGGGR